VKNKLLASFSLMVGLLMTSGPMFAHHGGVQYDSQHPVELKGVVSDFFWANPHSAIVVDVKDDKGGLTKWAVQCPPLSALERGGWTKHSLQVGDQVTVSVNPARTGAHVGTLRKVVLANGQVLSHGQLGEGTE
jgi:hypothetical protein